MPRSATGAAQYEPRGNGERDCLAAQHGFPQAIVEELSVAEPGGRIDDRRLKLRRPPCAGPGRFELQRGH